MKIAIMQPYFLPYIGYFQLLNYVDVFVIYDNIQYTKKGWINRNRILQNGKDEFISLPLKKGSDYEFVCERELANTFEEEKKKMLNKLKELYKKAPHFNNVFPVVEKILMCYESNLFLYINNSVKEINSYLGITTKIIVSSSIPINHKLKSEEKVIAIAQALNAKEYINPIGGVELYSKETFLQHNLELKFLQALPFEYKQFNNIFVPWLSILDVLMFNSKEKVQKLLNNFSIQ